MKGARLASGNAIAAALLVGGCASAPPEPESMRDPTANFAAYSTYGWAPSPGVSGTDPPLQLLDQNIRRAIAAEMQRRGDTETTLATHRQRGGPMSASVVIKGGTVVDGSGAPCYMADVRIEGGRITDIGSGLEADRVVDAGGCVVAPGFIDIHTHYDAQVFWDGTCSPSCYHGVTTIVGGNRGFSIAPLSQQAGAYLMRMLARVEGMPLESLEAGVPWDWSSFGEYLALLAGRLAVNAGFMVGHSAIRRVVMGERAVGAEATPAELDAMKALLRRSLAEGGLGFSSTRSAAHNDADGCPVPSRHATLRDP